MGEKALSNKIVEIHVPDIGNFAQVAVIEVNVAPGDTVKVDDPLITLESDKAAMEIPSTESGKIESVKLKVGDKVAKGDLILTLVTEATDAPAATEPVAEEKLVTINVPDIGTAKDVAVIEVNVAVGDTLTLEAPVVTLESEKASMEVPATYAGVVTKVLTAVGAKVSQGDPLIEMRAQITQKTAAAANKPASKTPAQAASSRPTAAVVNNGVLLSSPAVRRLARELDVDLQKIKGTGEKGRITKEDIKKYLQSGGSAIPAMPAIDFSQWGKVTTQPLSRIQKLSAGFLHRNWLNIPHVTQFDSADITNMEAFRKAHKDKIEKEGAKLTPLVFLMKAVVAALKKYPTFNSSLAADGESIVLKQYYHIGVAVDTPNGLVVPVIRDVDKKDTLQLAKDLATMSALARSGKLTAEQMQGSCFSISSLGGIGGTAFTPIINAPDVAILGVSKSQMQPVYIDGQFVPRLMLPLSLSYDHRVIDGAVAARFIVSLGEFLQDVEVL